MKITLPALCLGFSMIIAHAEIITLAHPEEPIPAQSTVVWSPLFQAAWDQLNLKSGGPPVRVEPPNALMKKLDSFQWNASEVMPEGSWKAWCGPSTKDFLQQVNQEASAITKEPEGPFTLLNESPGSLAFFGILDHEVEFHRAFFSSSKIPMSFTANDLSQPVRFFGVKGKTSGDYHGSVQVLAWRPVDRSFAIQIACKGTDDSVILYLPSSPQTFSSACHWLRTWRTQSEPGQSEYGAWNDRGIHSNDEIQIPYVSLDRSEDFQPQLTGARFHQGNAIPWRITRAEQVTRFELHEKGARVTVAASGQADPFAGPPPVTPRRFLFDRPFFVFLWRDEAKWPYFGAWIGDTSALKPFP